MWKASVSMVSRMLLLGFSLSVVLVVTAVHIPPAAACSTIAPPPALDGFPTDGSVDVPTDVIPIFSRLSAQIADPAAGDAVFELTAASGEKVALTHRQSHVWHFELVPASPLAPRTQYSLQGRWMSIYRPTDEVALSISFTTGNGPLGETPPVPKVSMQHYAFGADVLLTTCDSPQVGTCIAHPTNTFVEHRHLTGVNDPAIGEDTYAFNWPYLFGQAAMSNLAGINQGTPYKCIRFRTRAHNGRYSTPVVLCGEDAVLYSIKGSADIACSPTGLLHDGNPVSAPAMPSSPGMSGSSCAVTGTPSGGDLPSWLGVFALLAMLGARRYGRR